MPDDSSAKNNEREVLETGKPFSPIMFDPVLKKFTPDLPTGISGRPRCVLVQYSCCGFLPWYSNLLIELCFFMDCPENLRGSFKSMRDNKS